MMTMRKIRQNSARSAKFARSRQNALLCLDLLEPRVLLSLTNADVVGTWAVNGLSTAGSIAFNGSGAITTGSLTTDQPITYTPTGTYTTHTGGVWAVTDQHTARTGAVTNTKDFAVLTTAGVPGVQQDSPEVLTVLTKVDLTTATDADLNGTWKLYIDGDQATNTGVGTLIFNASGQITGGTVKTAGGTTHITSGNYTVSSTGHVSVTLHATDSAGQTLDVTTTGQLNDEKDMLTTDNQPLSAAAANHNTRLFVAVRSAATYTAADLTGSWAYEGNGFTGQLNFDGKGGVTGAGLDDDGDPFTIKGRYSIVASGALAGNVTITATGFPQADGARSLVLPAALNATKNILTLTDTPFNDVKSGEASGGSLAFALKTGDQAPTLATVPVLGSGVANVPFIITGNELVVLAGDADLDPVNIQVTSLGKGTFTLDGVPQTVTPFTVSGGQILAWTPTSTTVGLVTVMSVKAFDGSLTSPVALPVKVFVNRFPSVTVAASRPAASETNDGVTKGVGVYTISRTNGDITQPLTVHFTMSGTATTNDYTLVNGISTITDTVVIPAHARSVKISLVATNDAVGEGPETAILTISPDSQYAVGTPVARSHATVTIADNEPVITIAATRATASEKNPAATGLFTITRTGDLSQQLTIDLSVGGTGLLGTNYTLTSNGSSVGNTIIIPIGAKSVTVQVTAINNHTADKPALTAVLTLTTDTPYFINPLRASAKVTLVDAG